MLSLLLPSPLLRSPPLPYPAPTPQESLPDRELASGIAEIIKYGLIRDADLFHWLEANMGRIVARDPQALAYAIKRSCENKVGRSVGVPWALLACA